MTTAPTRLPLPVLALGLGLFSLTGLLLHLGQTDNPPAALTDAPTVAPVPSAARAVTPPAAATLAGPQSELQLGDPVVSMNPERGLLEAQLALAIHRPGQAPLTGSVQVTGQPRLDEASRRFYLESPTLMSASLPPLPATDRARVEAALRTALPEFFRQHAVFAPLEKSPPAIEPLRTPIS